MTSSFQIKISFKVAFMQEKAGGVNFIQDKKATLTCPSLQSCNRRLTNGPGFSQHGSLTEK